MLSFTINDLLAQARKIGASDLHVAAGAEAKCRVHGELRKLQGNRCLQQTLRN